MRSPVSLVSIALSVLCCVLFVAEYQFDWLQPTGADLDPPPPLPRSSGLVFGQGDAGIAAPVPCTAFGSTPFVTSLVWGKHT